MDKKLLDSLNNLSLALEDIADILAKKQSASSTGAALESGDFSKDLKNISVGIKSIKADTQEILKGQKTILEMSKKNSVGKTPMEEAGSDKKKESNIKKGVGTILLIAVAVLAIGMAFKLVGKIDFLSVVGLGLAMVIVAVAFEKIAKLNLGIKQAAIVSLTMVMMAAAITLSSWILKMITPIGFTQLLTAVFIAATFAVMSKYLENIFIATAVFSKLKVSKFALVTTLVSISAAITLSSWVLSGIKPIGLAQAMTGILIAAMFAVISFNLDKIAIGVVAFQRAKVSKFALVTTLVAISTAIMLSSYVLSLIKPMSFGQVITGILISLMFMVISFNLDKIAMGVVAFQKTKVGPAALIKVLVGIAAAITLSSWVLGMIKPIGIWQFLTALGITVLFAIMSYVMDKLAIGVVIIEKVLGKGKIFLIPLVLVAIATAIMLSSHILAKTKDITFMLMLKILALGVILALLTLVFVPAVMLLGKMKLTDLLKGGLAIVLVATAIMVSSHILAMGNYSKFPTWKWILGVGLSIGSFGLAMFLLGELAMTGIGALALLAGGAMVLLVAGTIVATSHILAMGKYSKFPSLEWSGSVALSMGAFAAGMVLLGGLIIATFGIGGLMLAAGSEAVLTVARTIVDTSFILTKGKYTGGPTKEWSEGIALALGAFSPVYGMLMDNAILSIFGGGGVGPDEFASAIRTVSMGIVDAANFFADPKVSANFKGGPPAAWAAGVGAAIGAFAPVYQVLAENSGWMASGVSPEDMKKAIMTISQGIVDAADFFAKNQAPFKEGNYPSESWGKGVGAALNAFAPVFKALHEDSGFWTSGDEVIQNMVSGVSSISWSIVDSALAFASVDEKAWTSYPSVSWAEGVSSSVEAYVGVVESVEGVSFLEMFKISGVVNQIAGIARILHKSQKYFKFMLDSKWVQNLAKNILPYAALTSQIDKLLGYDEKTSLKQGGFLGVGESTSTTTVRKMKDVSVVNRVASQMVQTARLLWSNQKFFKFKLDRNWVYDLHWNLENYAKLTRILEKLLTITEVNTMNLGKFGSYSYETTRAADVGVINKVVNQLVITAGILHKNKKLFTAKIDPNYMKNVASNVWDYAKLAKKLTLANKDSNVMDEILGLDPISRAAKGMVKIASAYDKLAKSLSGFGSALSRLDPIKVLSFTRLTGNIAMLSAMDSAMFSNMLNVLERRSGVFANMLKMQDMGGGKRPTVASPLSSGVRNKKGGDDATSFNKDKKGETQLMKLDRVIELLSKISTEVDGLDTFLQAKSKSEKGSGDSMGGGGGGGGGLFGLF
jgi:hypothetical protein